MTSDRLILICTILAAVLGLLTAVQTTRKNARDAATADQTEKAQIRAAGYAEGQRSRDDEIALLRSQRDDARRDRDRLQRLADDRERGRD